MSKVMNRDALVRGIANSLSIYPTTKMMEGEETEDVRAKSLAKMMVETFEEFHCDYRLSAEEIAWAAVDWANYRTDSEYEIV